MKKYLHKSWAWVKSLFVKEEIKDEISVEDAFRMWKKQQKKRK